MVDFCLPAQDPNSCLLVFLKHLKTLFLKILFSQFKDRAIPFLQNTVSLKFSKVFATWLKSKYTEPAFYFWLNKLFNILYLIDPNFISKSILDSDSISPYIGLTEAVKRRHSATPLCTLRARLMCLSHTFTTYTLSRLEPLRSCKELAFGSLSLTITFNCH